MRSISLLSLALLTACSVSSAGEVDSTRTGAPSASSQTPAATPADRPVVEDLSPPTTPVSGLILRTVRHRDRVFRVASLDLRQVELHLAGPASGAARATFTALKERLAGQDQELVWGTNAGIFGTDGRPLGLQVQDGTVRHGLNTGDGYGNFFLKPNGALVVDARGARIRTTDELVGHTGGLRGGTRSTPRVHRRRLRRHLLREPGASRVSAVRAGWGVNTWSTASRTVTAP